LPLAERIALAVGQSAAGLTAMHAALAVGQSAAGLTAMHAALAEEFAQISALKFAIKSLQRVPAWLQ